jgi:hypothetical protein
MESVPMRAGSDYSQYTVVVMNELDNILVEV